jgi:FMN phosphatase YigB (HAD superfamily)
MKLDRDPYATNVVEHLKKVGIKGVVFDLDDTCIYTAEIFRNFMEAYVRKTAEEMGLGYEAVYSRLSAINDEEYRNMGVSPKRWDIVCERLSTEFEDKQGIIMGNLPILKLIYATEPRVRGGVNAILSHLSEGGMRLGMVTHANVEWTEWKMKRTGLDRYFEVVVIADENKFKGVEHWAKALELMNLQGKEAVVVGDNLKGDIIPGMSLGMKGVWMPSPWSVYREGEVPSNTVQIDEFSGLLDGLHKIG